MERNLRRWFRNAPLLWLLHRPEFEHLSLSLRNVLPASSGHAANPCSPDRQVSRCVVFMSPSVCTRGMKLISHLRLPFLPCPIRFRHDLVWAMLMHSPLLFPFKCKKLCIRNYVLEFGITFNVPCQSECKSNIDLLELSIYPNRK